MIELLAAPTGSVSSAGVPLRELVLVGATATAVTFLLTSLVRVFAIRVGAVAVPRARDVHVIPTPRLGGIGMFIGAVAAIALAAQLPALNRGFAYSSTMTAVIVAGLIIVLVGVVDDRWGLDALTKFAGQVTAAGVLVGLDPQNLSWWTFSVPGSIGVLSLDSVQAGLLTVVITVATINAINFIDGLDGLAAGLGLVAALAICLYSLGQLRDFGGAQAFYPPAMITVALAGACLGFLPHNFSPARIFMGDSGAMLIGLMLAAASASSQNPGYAYGTSTADIFTLLSPLVLVAAVMFIPMLDMLMAIVRRTRAGVGFYTPDKMHLHHRLLELGHSQARVALLIYLWVGVLTLSVAASTIMPLRILGPIFGAGLLIALTFTFLPRIARVFRRT
ncbi:MAG: MraY family glycosyltransferase [Gordonia sp. (in: high G+C Gram-positive bacteria)]|uniref:glycosyltransferase family 4 protein n=1 Tax=Gordonia sp. (in: high G+C Gram-positive bacteria) TaxID=84139 RepID=UPI0039E5C7D6